MKIAKITVGNPNNKKGVFNNVTERIRFLQAEIPTTDAYLIRYYDDFFFRLLKRNFQKQTKEEYSVIDGIKYKNLWVKHRLIDYLLTFKLKRKAISCEKQLFKYADLFKEYDLVSPHGLSGVFLASVVKKRYNIPYVSTWHGSDINIAPFRNKNVFKYVKGLLKDASGNFFVSKKLLEVSDRITEGDNKVVLYTGPASYFFKYEEEQKVKLLKELNITTEYVVGFIGNFSSVKNVLILPEIFSQLQNKIKNISFVLVGDGNLGVQLREKCERYKINNTLLLGKQEPNKIPDIMNCIDVLLLPSLNEGLPMVTLEALSCGTHVVGSDVGGISESIGKENTFALDNDFVNNISNRIVDILQSNVPPKPLSKEFSWDKAVEKEISIYKQILGQP